MTTIIDDFEETVESILEENENDESYSISEICDDFASFLNELPIEEQIIASRYFIKFLNRFVEVSNEISE